MRKAVAVILKAIEVFVLFLITFTTLILVAVCVLLFAYGLYEHDVFLCSFSLLGAVTFFHMNKHI